MLDSKENWDTWAVPRKEEYDKVQLTMDQLKLRIGTTKRTKLAK